MMSKEESDHERALRSTRRKRAPHGRPAAFVLLEVLLVIALLVTATVLALIVFLPLPAAATPQATRIYDVNGQLVSTLFVENRILVPSKDIPDHLKKAVIAKEDRRFYSHHGVDFEALARAVVRNIKAGGIEEGGSTITQQLARTLYLSLEQTIKRKVLEAIYAVKLEMRYSKEEILTMYLNQIYFGHGAYGCEMAARVYFGKSAKDLTLPESALLAGILSGPEYYSPYNNLKAAVEHRNVVLDLMLQQGYITAEQCQAAKNAPVKLAGLPKGEVGEYFTDYVLSQIRERHPEIVADIYRGGYQIFTTMDLEMQKAAEQAFENYAPKGTKDAKGITQPQGALVAIDPSNGYIKALVGGRDWSETQLNRAYQAKRQPGSAFKIFLYTAVIDSGHPVTETRVCQPTTFGGGYKPRDFGSPGYHNAPLSIRQAVTISDNVVACIWANEIGPSKVAAYARKMGITSELDETVPIALGASEVTPLEMAVGAATLAAEGVRSEPLAILKIVDARGNVIEENRPRRTAVIDPGTAYVVTDILKSVLNPGGTGAAVRTYIGSRPAAGKTGTTDELMDAWFVGYTKELACAVYFGWDNREKALGGTGGSIAAPVWGAFMANALKKQPYKDWTPPANVVIANVCDETGMLAGPTCIKTHPEVFRKDFMPPQCTKDHIIDLLKPENSSNPSGQGDGTGTQNPGTQNPSDSNPNTGNGTSPGNTKPPTGHRINPTGWTPMRKILDHLQAKLQQKRAA